MRCVTNIILLSASLSFVIVVTSIMVFHDNRSVYRSIEVGDSMLSAYQLMRDHAECDLTGEHQQITVCRFNDFWHYYTVIVENGTVTEKAYRHRIDILRPRSLLPHSFAKWFLAGIFAIGFCAVFGSLWFLMRGPANGVQPLT